MQYYEVKNWDELKEYANKHLLSTTSNDLSKIHFVFDIDLTTLAYAKRGKEIDMMYDIYSNKMGYTSWGCEAIVDENMEDERTVVFMDKYVKDVYEYFVNNNAKITFVTARNAKYHNRAYNELSALGIKNPDIICAGGNSKADMFLEKYNNLDDNTTVVVLDDDTRHLIEFGQEKHVKCKLHLLRYAFYFKSDHC